MKTILSALLLVVSVSSFGQNGDKAAKLEKNLNKYKAEKAQFESHLKKLVEQLKVQDTEIEKKIKGTVDFIKRYKDSDQTNNRIIRNKEKVLNGLRKSIKNYSDRRQTIINEMKYGTRYFSDDMEKVKNWFDKKIELRVGQIVEITKSLDEYKEYYDRNKDGSHYNEKKRVERADRKKDKLIKEMKKGIAELTKKAEKLEEELDNVNTKLPMAEIANELTVTVKKIDLLQESIDGIWRGGEDGNKVGRKAALSIDKELREKTADIKSLSYTFFKQFDSTIRLLQKRKTLETTIDKYEFAIEQLR